MDTNTISAHLPGEDAVNFWVLLRGQDLSGDEEQIAFILPWLRERCATFSRCRARLAAGLFLHQDVSAAVFSLKDVPDLPILEEHLRAGNLYVGDADGRRLLRPAEAALLFAEALRWCDADYGDLCAEFGDMAGRHLAKRARGHCV